MRALQFRKSGSLSHLEMVELARPEPDWEEALVQVHAAAINPSDAKNVMGMMPHTTLPRVPGRDFAGVVVQGLLAGVEVWGTGGELGFTRDGSHAEYLVLPANALSPKPPSLSMEEAGSLGVACVTAWSGLMETGVLSPGETVLIVGLTGAVGSMAAQIARWKGCRVLGTIRSHREPAHPALQYADEVIPLHEVDLAEAVAELTGGKGVDLCFDTVGGDLFEPALHTLAQRGWLVEISADSSRRVSFDLLDFYRRESRILGLNTLHLDSRACAAALEQIAVGFAAGILQPPPVEVVPMEAALEAYSRVLEGTALLKPVLVPTVTAR
ncbi:MAG: zinc-binding alcohol dehydrogenase family protein [Armatimonadota bacterium]|nr:zinc-binding alcohol dehydrogenase family protein [Armatimonadota bacterium]